jgi:hypothetical protein
MIKRFFDISAVVSLIICISATIYRSTGNPTIWFCSSETYWNVISEFDCPCGRFVLAQDDGHFKVWSFIDTWAVVGLSAILPAWRAARIVAVRARRQRQSHGFPVVMRGNDM